MIDISFIGVNSLNDRLARMPDALAAALLAKSQALKDALVGNVRDGKLSGEVLAEKTGLLKNSIDGTAVDTGQGVSASVFVSGDVPYAAIQEYGGDTKAHVIEALNGKALAFGWQGKQAFFTHVNHPGSAIPERSYLRSALEEMQGDIESDFMEALGEALSA